MNKIFLTLLVIGVVGCSKKANVLPNEIKEVSISNTDSIDVFILAGQSNMAGRGIIEPNDTIAIPNVYVLNKYSSLVESKEPFHKDYEPTRTGLDLGHSFAKEISPINSSKKIILVPVAIGGTRVEQWLGDSLVSDTYLLSNFKEKIKNIYVKNNIKGILWHQGESNANETDIKNYENNLKQLFLTFRKEVGANVPIYISQIGEFDDNEFNSEINNIIKNFKMDNVFIVQTSDIKYSHKGDKLHFDSETIRSLGKAYADTYLKTK